LLTVQYCTVLAGPRSILRRPSNANKPSRFIGLQVKIGNRTAMVLRPQLSRVPFIRVSVSTRRCIKQNRQMLSVPLGWAHKRRGENVRDRKAGLGRVLFTSSPFQKFRLVENEPFDNHALPTWRASFRPDGVPSHELLNWVVPL